MVFGSEVDEAAPADEMKQKKKSEQKSIRLILFFLKRDSDIIFSLLVVIYK